MIDDPIIKPSKDPATFRTISMKFYYPDSAKKNEKTRKYF
jgi:hypothetical protein